MRQEELQKIRKTELESWLKELEQDNVRLEKELDDLEIKVERIRVRYELADKSYRRSSLEIINEQHLKPLQETFKAAKKEYEEKQVSNNQLINSNDKLIENIESVISVRHS